jgi:hypothetical protein
VYHDIPKLSLLAEIRLKQMLKGAKEIVNLELPIKIKQELNYCFTPTIKTVYPKLSELRRFVSTSLPNSERLHCTMKRINVFNNSGESTSGSPCGAGGSGSGSNNTNNKSKSFDDFYILYLEFLGIEFN